MAIINGRRIVPNSIPNGVHGSELARHAGGGQGRRSIIESGGKVSQINANRHYSSSELIDKYGRGAKISSMPDRSKGDGSAGPRRSHQSKQIITEQVIDLAEKLFKQGVEFDEQDADWLVIPKYHLPPNWGHITNEPTSILVHFPAEYPRLPPTGFYMPASLPMAHDGHFFNVAMHGASNAPILEGWSWYCVYIHNGAWRPSRNWRDGDNLWTYFQLIREALGNRE
jgi:hypothetical protein